MTTGEDVTWEGVVLASSCLTWYASEDQPRNVRKSLPIDNGAAPVPHAPTGAVYHLVRFPNDKGGDDLHVLDLAKMAAAGKLKFV